MKKYPLVLLLVLIGLDAFACEACKKLQPKFIGGITHGPGPDGNLDYLIVALMIAITLYTFYATVKCLLKPAENSEDHIKRTILNELPR